MMELAILGQSKTIEVADTLFDRPYQESLIHQVVVAYLAKARSGSKAQKNRAAVSGGGAKPWRQKGTGRARAGTIRSPLWKGGGVTFAASPRNHEQKVNRKMYRGALRSIFSELRRQERLIVVEDFKLEQPKTKALVAKLKELDVKEVLIVTSEVDSQLYLASRNLYRVNVIDVQGIDPVSLVGSQKVIMTVEAINKLQEWLG